MSASAPRAGGLAPAFSAVRAQVGLTVLLFAAAAAGWLWTADRMRGMDAGPWSDLGGFGWFIGVWVVMMAAMMLPSVSPTVALYARMSRDRAPLAPLFFVAGYLVTWAGAGWQRSRLPQPATRLPGTCWRGIARDAGWPAER